MKELEKRLDKMIEVQEVLIDQIMSLAESMNSLSLSLLSELDEESDEEDVLYYMDGTRQ